MRLLKTEIIFMGEKINKILRKPLYPYLYGLTFISFKSVQYSPSFSLSDALGCFLIFSFSCYCIDRILAKFSTSAYRSLSIILLFGSLLHVAGIAQLLGYNYAYIPTRFYLFFYLLILVIIITVRIIPLRFPDKYAPSLNKVINVFFLITTVVFIGNSYINDGGKREQEGKTNQITHKNIDTTKQKDIVWILLDEYASSASLKKQFGFHNPLDSVLHQKGFYVFDSIKTRFNNTLFSLNAIFHLDDSIRPSSFYAGVRSLRRSSWMSLLEKRGYQFVNLGFFDIGSHSKLANRSGYPQTYIDQLLSGTLFSLVYGNLKYTPEKCDLYNQEVLHRLGDTLLHQGDQPRFIWAHLTIPHEPFCRNSKGIFLTGRSYDETDSAFIKKNYVEYLQYGNSVILNLLKNHPELSRKILIISGDHGPRYPWLKDKTYQKWPFAAVLIPDSRDTVSLKKLQYISQLPVFLMDYPASTR